MPAKKETFVFPDAAGATIAVEMRTANALEFIAHYLDRIEAHLERLANQQPGAHDGVVLELRGIQRTLDLRLREPED